MKALLISLLLHSLCLSGYCDQALLKFTPTNDSKLICESTGVAECDPRVKVFDSTVNNLAEVSGHTVKVDREGIFLALCYDANRPQRGWIWGYFRVKRSNGISRTERLSVDYRQAKSLIIEAVNSSLPSAASQWSPKIELQISFEEYAPVVILRCTNNYPVLHNPQMQLVRILENESTEPVVLDPRKFTLQFSEDHERLTQQYEHQFSYSREYLNNRFECRIIDRNSDANSREQTSSLNFGQMLKNIETGGATSNWSPWSPWSACSQSCDGGIKSRRRECLKENVVSHGDCQGLSLEEEECSPGACPEPDAVPCQEVAIQNSITYTKVQLTLQRIFYDKTVGRMKLLNRAGIVTFTPTQNSYDIMLRISEMEVLLKRDAAWQSIMAGVSTSKLVSEYILLPVEMNSIIIQVMLLPINRNAFQMSVAAVRNQFNQEKTFPVSFNMKFFIKHQDGEVYSYGAGHNFTISELYPQRGQPDNNYVSIGNFNKMKVPFISFKFTAI